jgi:hypothetical protein
MPRRVSHFQLNPEAFRREKVVCNWSTDLLTNSFYSVSLLLLPHNMLDTNIYKEVVCVVSLSWKYFEPYKTRSETESLSRHSST